MLLFNRSLFQYHPVPDLGHDEKREVEHCQQNSRKCNNLLISLLCGFVALCLAIVWIVSSFGIKLTFVWHNSVAPSGEARSCVEPSFRREWRTLSRSDKNEYIRAVECLTATSSRLRDNGTLCDDFAWVHMNIATNTHGSAAFFSWHRYFINIYESMLKEQCGYKGSLPYWNWGLDWEDVTKAPVWDSENGFGGDGNATGETTVGYGRCVVDGPFAGLEVMFYDSDYHPHCLSRGFHKGAILEELCGKYLRPEVLEKAGLEADYESFVRAVEDVHLAIPSGVRGDLKKFTGMNDPVWFLHHAQLDRMWWTWQQADPETRLTEYAGIARSDTTKVASLADVLDYGGLAPDVLVSDIINTASGILCYRY